MFEQLYSIVKDNIGTKEMAKAGIADNMRESIVNEASGTIIDVLKSHIDKGKYYDLLIVFNLASTEFSPLIKDIVSKFSLRLDKFYKLDLGVAKAFSQAVIPVIMNSFVNAAKTNANLNKKGIYTLLNSLSGNSINFETFMSKMSDANPA